ncbi:MAG: hypothetical protein ACK4NQ_00045 [Fimbriimonadaceae bacterium]
MDEDCLYPSVTIKAVDGGYIVESFRPDPEEEDSFIPSIKVAVSLDSALGMARIAIQAYDAIPKAEEATIDKALAENAKAVNENPPAPARPKRTRKPKDQ